ncbi:WecB/TagA/CpsF family glycosyltransferase [Bradyrhizobium sp. LHD-71]|uniref:WecB/TagA/CpsF family glycosyltransferase n=1 Tax=Bradyrhizobium sp. LHD-71 TaxID=3072141 RepID=UPI00280E8A47|nr:WecB/TagA/CpsF family glycosyltransferase [Bradyrhizobium sp. LHD-71]MDQ8729767.1 WecB/TagA/CpsF family glycosyltransferase [Bradyrhizobium sp. LHD-71]
MTLLSARTARKFTVDGITINVPTMDEAISSIVSAVQQGQTFSVCTLNLDHVVHLSSRDDFRHAYRRARFVTADGFPIVVLGRLAKVPIRRTTGADLVEPICEEASRRGLSIFLLGSDDATLAESSNRLCERFPGLQIAGTYSPPRGFDPYAPEADEAIERVRASKARICFLALGSPKQEIFATRCLDRIPGTGLLCIGASLDFIAGTQVRAPRFAQQFGLEWLWRAMLNPKRLTPRYARCVAALPRLLANTIPQIIDARMGTLRWRQ